MSKVLQSIRGIHDGLPADVRRWQHIETMAQQVFSMYGFNEVRLPILEPSALFLRSIGDATDIVEKEMYSFEDKGGDMLSLRPEGTAGTVRAYLQGGLTRAGIQRWYYMGSMFRRERPQKGRLRQFQQIGVELLGDAGPVCDAELLTMAHDLLTRLNIPDLTMEINTLGCPVCRPAYRNTLLDFFHAQSGKWCDTCRVRMDKNPLRVLDCKNPDCQKMLAGLPEMLAHLCPDCDAHFAALKSNLDTLNTPYTVNPRIVRGLDYYSRTAFEIITNKLGAQGTVIAGGRYDALVESLGGPPTAAIGFALGLERLALLLPEIDITPPDVALVALGDAAQIYSIKLAQRMRMAGVAVVLCGKGAAKKQFKRADREQAPYVVIVGADEMAQQVVLLKDMRDGSQQEMTVDAAIKICHAVA